MRIKYWQVVICLLSFVTNTVAAETRNYEAQKITIGYQAANKQPVQGRQYTFPYSIYDLSTDSLQNLLLVLRKVTSSGHLKNKGSLCSLDPQTGAVKWEKEIKRFSLRFTKDLVLYKTEEGTKMMNKYTGAYAFTSSHDIRFINYDENKCLTAGGAYLDLANNKLLWNQKMSLGDYWSQTILDPADSTILIASHGVNKLWMNGQKEWQYDLKTTKEDYTAAVAVGAAAVVLGILGAGVVPVADADYISGLSSNMLVDTGSRNVYYSSLKSMVALTKDGKEIWNKEMNKRETSKSYLWQEDGKLIHVNLGYAYLNGAPSQQGVPFIAAYNADHGTTVFKQELGRKSYVSSFSHSGEKTLIEMGDTLLLYNHHTGKQLAKQALNKTNGFEAKGIAGIINKKAYFFKGTDSNFYALDTKYPDHFFVRDTAAVYRLNNNLGIDERVERGDFWITELVYKDVLFLRNKEQVAIVKDHVPLAFLTQKGTIIADNGQLLIVDDNLLTVVPLPDILGH